LSLQGSYNTADSLDKLTATLTLGTVTNSADNHDLSQRKSSPFVDEMDAKTRAISAVTRFFSKEGTSMGRISMATALFSKQSKNN
jgi:hypothetical protein